MPAPWRQTVGAGGSEFGKLKWFTALKCGFKTAGETPHFKLWQLALADHVVRFVRFIFVHYTNTYHFPFSLGTKRGPYRAHEKTNTHLQANILINPSNPKAIGSDGNSKGVGGDTVDGVRLWSSKLAAALKGVNPAPVIVNSDSQDASQPPMRIELTIEGYRAAGQGNTMPPAA